MISKRNFAEILENFLTAGHIAAAFLKIWLDLMQNLLANKLTITKIHRKSEWEISLNLSVGYIVLAKINSAWHVLWYCFYFVIRPNRSQEVMGFSIR